MFSSGTSFDRDVDGIFNFHSTDQFDFSAFGFAVGMTDAVTDASFVSSIPSAFSRASGGRGHGCGILVLYVDAIRPGTSTPDPTCSSEFDGDVPAELENINAYIFNGPVLDPGLPFRPGFPQHDNHAVRPGPSPTPTSAPWGRAIPCN